MAPSDDIRAASPAVKLTSEDFLPLPLDGKRHELIDGEYWDPELDVVRIFR
jgi:hypothetical protein